VLGFQLRDGSILFLVGVAPAAEAGTYLDTFGRVRQSVQIADQWRRRPDPSCQFREAEPRQHYAIRVRLP
jgi:hypothetical protein